MKTTRLVAATRMTQEQFWKNSMLGRSLRLFPAELLPELCIRFENHGDRLEGLSTLYNRAIDSASREKIILFVHDDVFIHDIFLQHRLAEAIERYDVVGLAGSRQSDLKQPSWGLAFDENLRPTGWQRPEHVVLSGAVSHGQLPMEPEIGRLVSGPPIALGLYGNFPAACDLLDGLFLAAHVGMLASHTVRFDPQFDFHLYDLDFCRTAKRQGLELGTWPILVTHASGGNFDTEPFRQSARRYLDKWAPSSEVAA